MNNLIAYIEHHGFEAFINIDGKSVSFYLPISDNSVTLVTVRDIRETRTALGY